MTSKINIPPFAQGAIVIFVLAGVGIGSYLIYQNIKQKKEAEKETVTLDLAKAIYAKLVKSGEKLSYPESAYSSVANDAQIKLNGCDKFTTELEVIDSIVRTVKKPIDWYYLVSLFGVREIDDCIYGKTTYAFPELLKDQLDTGGIYVGMNGGIGSGITTESIQLLRSYLSKLNINI